MTAEEFATLLTFATAMSFTPGPNTMLATALAANFGMRRAWRFIVAVPTGWTLMMIACGLGLGALVFALPWLRGGVKAIGVAYLVWLAWKLANTRALAPAAAARMQVGFWQGVALQFVNIKAWMLALALAAGWVATSAGQASSNPGERLAIVCAVMAVFALSSNAAYALAGSLLRRWLAVNDRLLWFNRGMALLLLATAVWMALI
jgi:threonine/homoserine/homoserine lactone efflux protein